MIGAIFRRSHFAATAGAVALLFMSVSVAGVLAVEAAAETASPARKHKIRSAHFVVTALTKKGFKVEGVRRKAQVYFVRASQGGSIAILAIDGYSAEIVGLKLIKVAAGVSPKKRGSGARRFADITYEFGYIIRESVYESYTLVSSTEITSTEEYSFVSYSESEEVTYEEVEHSAEADLDEGSAEDAVGDAEANANDDQNDGAADDTYNASDDPSGADNTVGEDGAAGDDASAVDTGSDDGASDDNSGGNDDGADSDDGGSSDDSGGGNDDSGSSDDGGGNDDGGGSDDG